MLESARVTCPWCWQSVELVADCSAGTAEYVEDCAVCCRPMRVRVRVTPDGALLGIDVEAD